MSKDNRKELVNLSELSKGEKEELIAMGLISALGEVRPPVQSTGEGFSSIPRTAISAYSVLNEAYDYGVAFSRGLRMNLGDYSLFFISGTASVDENGKSVHPGDIRAQCWRTYRNITALLAGEGATWKDVIKTTCYLRDIERDYDEFNKVRTAFFDWLGLNPLPASVGIQARLCREDLLIEIEAIVLLKKDRKES